MATDCKFCHKPIKIEPIGNDPTTGKMKWKRTNEDNGTEHKCGNFTPKEPLGPKLDKIITLLERISGQLANK